MTAGQLLHLALPNQRSELVRGRLIVREPAGSRHGAVAARIAYRLMAHVEERGAGRVYAAETGFTIATDPDTVRAPDVAFVVRARLVDPEPAGFFAGPPDLAVEVLSPDDRPGEVLQKVGDWLSADGSASLVRADGVLSGEDVLPDFTCPLTDLW